MLDIRDHGGTFGGGLFGSNIKSIQRGTTTFSGVQDVTISPVDSSNSIVIISYGSTVETENAKLFLTAELTSSTNLQIFAYRAGTRTVSWTVIEFNNVKSIQRGNFALTGTTSQSVAVTSINPAKSILFFNFITTSTSTNNREWMVRGAVTSATSIEFEQFVSVPKTVKWQLIEFK